MCHDMLLRREILSSIFLGVDQRVMRNFLRAYSDELIENGLNLPLHLKVQIQE